MSDEVVNPTSDADTDDLILQCGRTVVYLKNGTKQVTEVYIGEDDAVAEAASSNLPGASYQVGEETGKILTSKTEKIASDRSKWYLSYTIPASGGGQSGGDNELSEVWSMTNAQYTFSLYKYCNPTEAKQLNEWENAEGKPSPTEWIAMGNSLTGKAYEVAKLIFAGTTEVQRCYPQVVRTRTFDEIKNFALELNVATDDLPDGQPFTFDETMSWLKSGFDWSQSNDGICTLTESWIGVPDADGGWNTNLYKDWNFYYESEEPEVPVNGNQGGN